ncbi:MAG: acylphosphatase [Chloroflexi bacterium]|nr:acylphosphatase [Chloroflexota bacterium]
MPEVSAFLATVHGRVQGVNFRAFVQQCARALGIAGYVKNLPDGRSVEVRAEGEKEKLEELVDLLHSGPEGARVERVEVDWQPCTGSFSGFSVRR